MTDHINNAVIEKAVVLMNRHLCRYQGAIEKAYCSTDDAMDVGLKVRFKPNGNGVKVETFINFISDRIKDSNSEVVGKNEQLELPMGQTGEASKTGIEKLWFYTGTDTPKPERRPKAGYNRGQWRVIRSRTGLK